MLNEKAYTPQCVSIGLYHHVKPELKAMEEHKKTYLQHSFGFSKVSLERFVACIRDNEIRLRNCYLERSDSSERFVRTMLVDATFVIMVMLRSCCSRFRSENELIFNKPWMINDIAHDMILLENHLPFCILDEILVLSNLVINDIAHDMILLENHLPFYIEILVLSNLVTSLDFSMIQLSSNFLNLICYPWVLNNTEELNFYEFKHLVDFLRIGQKNPILEQKTMDVLNLPTAVELHRAGVKFKCGSSLRLVNMKFQNGMLEIPTLKLRYDTKIYSEIFRHLSSVSYIFMINFLVRDRKDVEMLTQVGIIDNWLSEFKKFNFADLVDGLSKYCSKRRHKWRAALIQNYFHNPWAIISVVAAAYIIILLSTIQIVCSILKVKQQQ